MIIQPYIIRQIIMKPSKMIRGDEAACCSKILDPLDMGASGITGPVPVPVPVPVPGVSPAPLPYRGVAPDGGVVELGVVMLVGVVDVIPDETPPPAELQKNQETRVF